MKRILFAILIIISLTGDSYSQRIPFAFWNRLDPDTLELDAPTLIAPADDTTGVDQSPLLDWDGVLYATNYIVQLDNDTNFSPVSWTDTTVNSKATVELGLVQGTTWYWRVLAFNIFDTSEWSVTYSFTVTTGPALTTPVLIFPADDTTNISQLPVLDWDTVLNVRHYVVQLSDTTTFTTIHWSDSVTISTATVDTTLDYSTTWYWRVIAYNDFDTSEWSDTNSFTVRDPNIAAPTLITPANGDTGVSQSPTLVWSAVDDADFYNIQLTQYSDFTSVLWNANSFDTSKLVSMTLLEGTKWYWRVRSINTTDTSSWSSSFAFIVTSGPAIARAYYIDATSGKDEYNGRSTSLPWQTTERVNEHTFIPGDSILFKGGETFQNTNLVLSQSGTNVNPIVISSYNGSRSTLNTPIGNSILISNGKGGVIIKNLNVAGNYDAINQTGADTSQEHIGIRGYDYLSGIASAPAIIIDSVTISGFKQNGIDIGADTSHGYSAVTIKNSIIYNCGIQGIRLWGLWYKDVLIQNNKIYNILGRDGTGPTVVYGFPGNGISLSNVKEAIITRNLIYNCGEYAYMGGVGIVSGNAKSLIVSYNEIYGTNGNIVDGDGIDLDLGSDSCIVEYNYIHNVDGDGIMLCDDGRISSSPNYNIIRYNIIKYCGYVNSQAGITIAQNSGGGVPIGNIIQNNTIITKRRNGYIPSGIRLYSSTTTNTKIKNNIILGDSSQSLKIDDNTHTGLVIQGNCYWDRNNTYYRIKWGATTYTNVFTWAAATGQEVSGSNETKLVYNPLLNNPFTTNDTIGNAYMIDTLTNYKFVDASLMRNNGVKSDSSYLWSSNTTDFFGGAVPKDLLYDVGAFEDTTTLTYTYTALTQRLLGRDTSLLNQTDRYITDSLIAGLTSDTLISKMDLFYILARQNQYSSLFNIIRDTFNLSYSPTIPTFTAHEGYTGNGTSSYLSTSWIPSVNAVNYTLNNAGLGVYSRTDTSGNFCLMGTSSSGNYMYFRIKNSGLISPFINNADLVTTAYSGVSTGFFSANRVSSSGANAVNVYKDGSILTNVTSTSTSLPTTQLRLLSNGAVGAFSPMQISFAYVSSALTASNISNLNKRVETYLMRYGKGKELPITTALLSPDDGEDSLNTTLDTLDWTDVFNANEYHLQVDDNMDFSSLTGEVTSLTNSRYIVGGTNPGAVGSASLDSNATYYWRVRSTNTNGNSAWSSTFSFNTHSIFQTESKDLFARFPNGVGSLERKYTIDSLIIFLKADTIWSKADLIYVYAAEDTGQAKVNWKSSSYTSTLVNSPTFTVNRGFTGNGSSSYINTNWTPSTNGVNYKLDSSSLFAYVRNSVIETKSVMGTGDIGVNLTRLVPGNVSNQIEARINQNTTYVTGTLSDFKGFYSVIRSGPATTKIYKWDTLKATSTVASSGLPSYPMLILARNAVGSPTDFTTREVSFVIIGGKFSDYKQTIISRRVEWYLNRVGAIVFKPSYVILNSPLNGATGVSIVPTYDWDNVGANYYQIEIDDDIAFSTPFYSGNVSSSDISGELAGDLNNNTVYYWRVRGVNSIGTGAWSSTYSFTTTP